jgi:uncharacterized protein with PIN domain
VPHTEVDLILVDGASVGYEHRLHGGERIAVYPVFESLDISPMVRVRPRPLRRTAFILDVHLGKLARLLRMLGLDVLYRNDYPDALIVRLALEQRRIILTRDRELLKRRAVTHGYWLRATDPMDQAREVVRRFDLASQCAPLTRCIACNGRIEPVPKRVVRDRLQPGTAARHDEFYRCPDCDRIYWPGSHYERMRRTIEHILSQI